MPKKKLAHWAAKSLVSKEMSCSAESMEMVFRIMWREMLLEIPQSLVDDGFSLELHVGALPSPKGVQGETDA